ncbi:hypothetical protein BDR22DRAFT_348043 [Usnea florida]
MGDFEDHDKIVGTFSPLKAVRPEYFFRFREIPQADRALEIEVQVLGPRSNPLPNTHPISKQDRVIGKAFIRTSESRNWEASLELIQADTAQGFLTIEIYAGLLRCICDVCNERHISHITMPDVEPVSQTWYRDFFRLAGFHRCQCPSPSAGSSIQQDSDQNRNCLSSFSSSASSSWRRVPEDEEASLRRASETIRAWLVKGRSWSALDDEEATFSNVCKTFRTWLAEGRCSSGLLDSIASGEAAEVERKHFHKLLTEAINSVSRSSSKTNQKKIRRAPGLKGKVSETGTRVSSKIIQAGYFRKRCAKKSTTNPSLSATHLPLQTKRGGQRPLDKVENEMGRVKGMCPEVWR